MRNMEEEVGAYERVEMMNNSSSSSKTSKALSPTTSDSSNTSCVSNDSSADSNFDYFGKQSQAQAQAQAANNITNNVIAYANGVHDDGLITPLLQDPLPLPLTHGASSFFAHENGSTLQESNGGVDVLDVRSNASNPVGLKYIDSFLQETSTAVVSTETVIVQNGILNQNKNAAVHKPEEEIQPQVEEYDVERVIRTQETHDLICPTCRSCITKRVILRRRKRKFPDISAAEEASGSEHDQSGASDDVAQESQQSPQVGKPPDSRLDAISCFSCFSIFIPSGEGFLCWRFKPKADTTLRPDGTSIGIGHDEDSSTDSKGTIFPLWVVTCCQPAEREKPEASPHQTEPPLPSSDALPVSSTPESLLPEHIEATGLPSTEGNQQDAPSSEIPSKITADEGGNFPLWFLTCCQPSTVGTKPDHSVKLDENEPPPQGLPSATSGHSKPNHLVKPGFSLNEDETMLPKETSSAPGGTESDYLTKPVKTVSQEVNRPAPSVDARPSLVPSDDNPTPVFNPESPAIFVPGTSSPTKPITAVIPTDDDIPLLTPIRSPALPENAVLPMPPVIPSDSHEAAPLVDAELGLPRESRRHGVSGLDIIKAIVYGGLLESITSLSVITSAAGGDATTLNIVALGLANVFGGLVVLIHNLRVLKHEHTTEHYEAQLGRPGHYMLHAIVAIVSYLVFGLMSPIIYGFAFRKSDNKDYKMATLAAATFACITLLSLAKSYVQNPPKAYIKTVFYYVSLGVMVSGLGYVAGDVINTLLKKFGVFDSRAADNVSVLAVGMTNGAWSSF